MSAPLTIIGSGMAGLGLARQVRARQPERPITLITADGGEDYSKPLLSTGFAKRLPPDRLASRSALEAADRLGVTMRTHTRVEAIDPAARTLALGAERLPWGERVALGLDDGTALEADLVLVATGLRPRSALAEAAGLAVGPAGILVDRRLSTSAPGIHALGDVACVDGVNAMYVQPLQAGAKALAATLAGMPTEVRYGPWPVLVKTPLLPVVSLPPTRAPARWRIEGEGADLTALAEDEDGRLIGFALTGACVRRKVELARAAPPLLG
ncbi:FAD-dependent oxidoreductase [Halomonas smyrnensis]|uniref:FAD-dependent oxidoreductase n=1 Tax=Halomonas smyrnensis TaxID=720605 RepID=UPI0002ED8BF7|nr:FAD-dependent oxidoreductase [Halomonas smyrnensis]